MVNNTVYQFVGSNLGVENFSKRGNIKKRCAKKKIEEYTLYFEDITLYTYVLKKILQNGVYTKTDSWFQNSHEKFGEHQTSTGNSRNLKFDGPLLSKNKLVQKIHSLS